MDKVVNIKSAQKRNRNKSPKGGNFMAHRPSKQIQNMRLGELKHAITQRPFIPGVKNRIQIARNLHGILEYVQREHGVRKTTIATNVTLPNGRKWITTETDSTKRLWPYTLPNSENVNNDKHIAALAKKIGIYYALAKQAAMEIGQPEDHFLAELLEGTSYQAIHAHEDHEYLVDFSARIQTMADWVSRSSNLPNYFNLVHKLPIRYNLPFNKIERCNHRSYLHLVDDLEGHCICLDEIPPYPEQLIYQQEIREPIQWKILLIPYSHDKHSVNDEILNLANGNEEMAKLIARTFLGLSMPSEEEASHILELPIRLIQEVHLVLGPGGNIRRIKPFFQIRYKLDCPQQELVDLDCPLEDSNEEAAHFIIVNPYIDYLAAHLVVYQGAPFLAWSYPDAAFPSPHGAPYEGYENYYFYHEPVTPETVRKYMDIPVFERGIEMKLSAYQKLSADDISYFPKFRRDTVGSILETNLAFREHQAQERLDALLINDARKKISEIEKIYQELKIHSQERTEEIFSRWQADQ